jgi:hypothetical protein
MRERLREREREREREAITSMLWQLNMKIMSTINFNRCLSKCEIHTARLLLTHLTSDSQGLRGISSNDTIKQFPPLHCHYIPHSTETLMYGGTHTLLLIMLAFYFDPITDKRKPHTHAFTSHTVVIVHHSGTCDGVQSIFLDRCYQQQRLPDSTPRSLN